MVERGLAGRVLDVATNRGDGRRWCGLQLLAWTAIAPIAAVAVVAIVLCLGPAA